MNQRPKNRQYQKRIRILQTEAVILIVSTIILVGVVVYLGRNVSSAKVASATIEEPPIVLQETDVNYFDTQEVYIEVSENDFVGNMEIKEEYEAILPMEAEQSIKDALAQNELTFDTENEYAWLKQHRGMYPKEKIEAAEGNKGLIHFLYQYGMKEYETGLKVSLTENEVAAEIPLLMQWDERWGFEDYGSFNIGISGCGPTCLSMILVGLTKNEELTPLYIADYAMKNGYYMAGTGTMWALFTDFSILYDVACKDLAVAKEDILGELEKGHPVICSMRRGQFTRAGHFIVLKKVEDDIISINDPNSLAHSMSAWKYEDFSKEIAHAWSFEHVN